MDDHRSAADIERGLERDRAGLADTLDDLRDKFSLDAVIRQAIDQFREHGGDTGASVSRAVKDNPMALALTGVGLAWLIFGDGQGDRNRSARDRDDRASSRMRTPAGGYGTGMSANGMSTRRPAMTARPVESEHLPDWVRDGDRQYDATAPHGGDADRTGSDDHGGLGALASDAADAVRSGVSDAATSTRDGASALWHRLAEGTEQLSDEGRDRVIAARERAHHARDAAMDRARQGQDRAMDMFDEQPLIAGVLALAVGAAIAAALPRTEFEDDRFGAESDALFHDAERILTEERAKVGAVIGAAMDEARDIASETGSSIETTAQQVKADADRQASGVNAAQDVADKTKDSLRDAGQRISDTARAEADRQNLGKIPS